MSNTVLSYPIPAFSNPPIQPQFYKPKVFVISGISVGITTIVTTTLDMDYVIGQLVRLTIPSKYGSRALNEVDGYVLSIPTTNSVEIDINSLGTDPFIASPTFLPFQSRTLPQIMAIGDINTGAINATGRLNTGTFLPGSFLDISPL